MNKIKSGMKIFEKGQKIHITEWGVLEEVIEVGTKYKQAIYKTNNIIIGDVKNSDIDFDKTLKAMEGNAIWRCKDDGDVIILLMDDYDISGYGYELIYKIEEVNNLDKDVTKAFKIIENEDVKESPRYLVEEEFGVPKHILEGHREFKVISAKEDENGLFVEFEEFSKEKCKHELTSFVGMCEIGKWKEVCFKCGKTLSYDRNKDVLPTLEQELNLGYEIAFDINHDMARKYDSQEEVSGYFVNGPTIRAALNLGLEKYVGGLELACELHMEEMTKCESRERLSRKANEKLISDNCKFYDMLVEDKMELEKCIDKIKTLKRENELQSRNIDLRDKEIEELKNCIREIKKHRERARESSEDNFDKFVKVREENELLRKVLKSIL